jgi:hypothetical protein
MHDRRQSIRSRRDPGRVLLATLICSDEACAGEVELVLDDLTVLDVAACDCGCTTVVLALAAWSPAELPVFA